MLSRILAVSVVVGLAGFALSGCVSEDGYYSGYSTYGGGYYAPGPYVYDDYYAPAGGVYYGGTYYRDRRHWRDRDGRWRGRNHGQGHQVSGNSPSHHGTRTRYRLVEHPRNDLYPARPGTRTTGSAHHGYRLANPDQ